MKARVVKKYKDKYSKKVRKVGEELEISQKRFKEINSTKYGKLVEEVGEDG